MNKTKKTIQVYGGLKMNRKEMKIQLQTLQNIFRSIGLIRSGELSPTSLFALAAIEYDVISGFSQALGDNHGLLEWFIYYNEWGSRKLSVQIDDGPERVITNYDDILNVIEDLQE